MTDSRQQIFQALDDLGRKYPDMRFGQLVVNIANWATQKPDAAWDVEDEEFLAAALRHLGFAQSSPPASYEPVTSK